MVLHALSGPARSAVAALLLGAPLLAQFPPVLGEAGTPVGAGDEIRVDSCSLGPGLSSSVLPCVVGTASGPGGDDLHVVWQDYRDATSSIYYRRVAAFGAGAQPCEVRLSAIAGSPQHHASEPRLATDGVSELYVAYHAFAAPDVDGSLDRIDRIMFVRSLDAGASWSAPVELGSADFATVPEMCTDGEGRIYAVWTQTDTPYGVADVYLAASDDSGASWTAPKRVNDDTSAHSQEATVACDAHGTVVVAYLDHRRFAPALAPADVLPPERYREVFVHRTSSAAVLFGGAAWPAAEQLSHAANAGLLRLVAFSSGAGSVPDREVVLCVWNDYRPVARAGVAPGPLGDTNRLVSSYAIDGGPFLTEPLLVSSAAIAAPTIGLPPGPSAAGPPGPLHPGATLLLGAEASTDGGVIDSQFAGPAFYGVDLAVDHLGRVHALYARVDAPVEISLLYPAGNAPTYLYACRFDPNQQRWGPETRLSTASAPFGTKKRPLLPEPRLAVDDGGRVFAAWMQSGIEPFGVHETYADVNAAWSTDGGVSWHGPSGLTNKPAGAGSSRSAHPAVFARDGVGVVVWDDRRAHTAHDVPGGLQPGDPLGAPDLYLTLVTP